MSYYLAFAFLISFPFNAVLVNGLAQCTSAGICSLENYFRSPAGWPDRQACKVAQVFFPASEEDLLMAVSQAVKQRQKVKVVSRGAHTLTKFACPNSGVNPGFLISTSKYNTSITINKEAMEVTADAGVQLRDLLDHLAKNGLALVQSIYWDGVSVSGMISTGAHGSSLWNKGGGTYEYVVAIRFVVPASPAEGYAKAITLKEGDPDFEAARISLGVLGAISKVTFRVQPMFKRSITFELKDDGNIENEVMAFGLKHEFSDVSWFPALGKVLFRMDDRVPVTTPGDGVFNNGLVAPGLASLARKGRENEEALQEAKNATGICSVAKRNIDAVSAGNGLLNDGQTFTGYPVMGFNHRMQSSGGCQYQYENSTNLAAEDKLVCAWDYGAHGSYFSHVSVGVPVKQIKNFIKDVKRLRNTSGEKLCGMDFYIGLLMRFVKGTTAYLGHKEDVVQVEFMAYRDRRPLYPQPFEDITEELEQMLVRKYNGIPHYGKNRPVGFVNLRAKVRNLEAFLEVKQKMDRLGLFSSDWSNAVLGIEGQAVSIEEKCALNGLCACQKDEHCAPELGYFCKPGEVYQDARVCKYLAA